MLVASLLSCVFLFFPWFIEGSKWFNAFDKILLFGLSLFFSSAVPALLVLREALYKKGYFFGIANQTLLIFLLSIGLYTLVLYTFSLYELLNDNARTTSDVGSAGMFLFLSMGIALGGAIVSRSFFPKPKPKNLMDSPASVDTSKNSLSMEKQHLFNSHD